MQIAALYLITTAVFLSIDAVGIRFMIKPIFDRHIAELYPDVMRVGPAALFYLGYIAGLLYLVSVPALRAGSPASAILPAIIFGLVAYGTYEFTNYATIRLWSVQQVVVDTLWGGALTGFSAWAGLAALRAFSPAA
ncbi:DUF2177 family protein [Sinirhodobacter sp. WL0062]|uniref:DUF2177 family protein n=1 Tax=Rhodobacter flavimaris TaxID=2907145 RepID=A0ABS8YRE9_9RHOB|nr:DUF2177 family protein [Sinirhodobacter sp. WL0062]MCE5972008.1 DUF2177 family protein [Sinirhodobacter sp. WL0062]